MTPADKALFTVEDGEIVGRTKGDLKKNEFLVTEKPYGDFVLKAKVKIRNGNSGIQFRSKRQPDGVVSGPQADVADGYWGLLYEERGRGILERYPEEKANALVKKGDWNDFVITAKGEHVTIDFNGTRVIDRNDPKFDKEGIIALQVHVGPPMEVRYKDIADQEPRLKPARDRVIGVSSLRPRPVIGRLIAAIDRTHSRPVAAFSSNRSRVSRRSREKFIGDLAELPITDLVLHAHS